jgi:hypothetical protein
MTSEATKVKKKQQRWQKENKKDNQRGGIVLSNDHQREGEITVKSNENEKVPTTPKCSIPSTSFFVTLKNDPVVVVQEETATTTITSSTCRPSRSAISTTTTTCYYRDSCQSVLDD